MHPRTRSSSVATPVFFVCALSLTSVAAGQGHLYSPAYLAASEGHDLVPLFGYRPSMRYQMVDGEIRGRRVILKEVALRLNHTTGQSPWIARGRSWSSVVLRVAEGDSQTFGTDFAKNVSSPPTVVFSGGVAWPTVDTPRATRPAPWGGAGGAYRFPFRGGWLFGGNADVVTDWTFRGGTLANSLAWSRTNLWLYHFDGFGSPSSIASSTARRIPANRLHNNSPGVTGRCNDSAYGIHYHGSYLDADGHVYGSASSPVNLRDQLVLRSRAFLTAPGASVIHAWGFAADEIGVDVGSGCNRLHIRGPWNAIPVLATSGGFSVTPDFITRWKVAYADARLTMQAGWADSGSGRIALTQALELRLPGHAPPTSLPARRSIYESDVVSVRGPFATGNHNPGLRYTH